MIYQNKQKLEEYVSEWYFLSKYLKSYENGILAMPGPDSWPEGGDDVILPHFVRV